MKTNAGIISLLMSILTMGGLSASPFTKADGAWITLSGTVKAQGAEDFQLNYGAGEVLVELDSYRLSSRGYILRVGQSVTVTGRVDADDAERTIEAAEVKVHSTGQIIVANADDEEDVRRQMRAAKKQRQERLVRGTVLFTAGELMTLEVGDRYLDVFTGTLGENIFDRKGSLQVEAGDHVVVSGAVVSGYKGSSQFMAVAVNKVRPNRLARLGR